MTNSDLYSKIDRIHKQMQKDYAEILEKFRQLRKIMEKILDSSATSQMDGKDEIEEVDEESPKNEEGFLVGRNIGRR